MYSNVNIQWTLKQYPENKTLIFMGDESESKNIGGEGFQN